MCSHCQYSLQDVDEICDFLPFTRKKILIWLNGIHVGVGSRYGLIVQRLNRLDDLVGPNVCYLRSRLLRVDYNLKFVAPSKHLVKSV